MPKALLVDTSFSSWPILEALERRGFEVHVVGSNPNDVLARAHVRYHSIDYSNSVILGSLVDDLRPDCLVPGCNDRSYIACAAVADGREFAGIDSTYSTEIINNKARFREVASGLGLSTPRVLKWPSETPKGPVIVKPVDGFSGMGVTLVTNPSLREIEAARRAAMAASRAGQCLVEEFIDGQLYSHSAFVSGRRIVQDFWVIEYSSANPFVVDTSHLDTDLDDFVMHRLREEIETMTDALGLVDGLIHTQFIVCGSRFAIVESTRRCPGDLYSQLIQLSTGFDYPDAYIAPFIGTGVSASKLERRSILRHTLTGTTTLRFQHLSFSAPFQIARWVPLANCGDELYPSPKGRMGILFAEVRGIDELKRLAERAANRAFF